MAPDRMRSIRQLIAEGIIDLEEGPLLQESLTPKPDQFDFGRVEGMLLGLAIGDALGVTTESQVPGERRTVHGEIRDYLQNEYRGDRRGYPSDDSQLAFWTLEHSIEVGRVEPDRLAQRFARGGKIVGIGKAMRGFIRNVKRGVPWHRAGVPSAGNGALMRMAPVLVPHLRTGGTALWEDVAVAATLTHNDATSTACCLAFTRMLWELLDLEAPPPRTWWRERFVSLAGPLEGDTRLRPRGGAFTDYCGSLTRFVDERLRWAEVEEIPTLDACDAWYSGAYLLETVPCALLILSRYAHDPEQAIVRAVNDTRDNDTVAAIVGAAVGALHGRVGLPARWVEGLSGWTRYEDGGDEGRVFELLDLAHLRFWKQRAQQQLEKIEPDEGASHMPGNPVTEGFRATLTELDRYYVRLQDAMRTATSSEDFAKSEELHGLLRTLAEFRGSVSAIEQEWQKGIGPRVLKEVNKPVPKSMGPHGKSPKSGLRVTLADQRVIAEVTAAETLASVLEALGLEAVAALGVMVAGVPLVSRTPQPKYSSIKRGTWYVMTHSSTDDKRKKIEYIASKLRVPVRVEITGKDKSTGGSLVTRRAGRR